MRVLPDMMHRKLQSNDDIFICARYVFEYNKLNVCELLPLINKWLSFILAGLKVSDQTFFLPYHRNYFKQMLGKLGALEEVNSSNRRDKYTFQTTVV